MTGVHVSRLTWLWILHGLNIVVHVASWLLPIESAWQTAISTEILLWPLAAGTLAIWALAKGDQKTLPILTLIVAAWMTLNAFLSVVAT